MEIIINETDFKTFMGTLAIELEKIGDCTIQYASLPTSPNSEETMYIAKLKA